MALSGTIETFSLPDVLRLLASTSKTGHLKLEGSRGTGGLWIADGQVVGGDVEAAPHAKESSEVLFELLRFSSGDFVFDDDETTDDASAPAEVEPLLESAEKMLEEWQDIEKVVPSLEHHVGLVAELSGDEVVVSADNWRTLAALGGGTSVGRLGDSLELGELAVSKAVKELVELGLAEIDEPHDEGAPVSSAAPPVDEGLTAAPDDLGPDTGLGSFEAAASGEPAGEESFDSFDPGALSIEDSPLDSFDASAAGEGSEADAAEIARQLANLSPKAAKAVAAAAKATTPEERDAALAEVDEEEDPINRDLLIKFLGSVSS